MNLILIRHAETAWNRGGLIQGHQDSALTARGLQETTALLTTLAQDFPSVDMVYTSPAGRARHMCEASRAIFAARFLLSRWYRNRRSAITKACRGHRVWCLLSKILIYLFSTSNGKMKCIRKIEL
ncbi:histidine phosphatase family protein [Cronobacter dublinensis]|uniref:histidine phosphatase family protein n=1 Tax=Cronobacter dublinensis TaxID=413497 RepID=UPI001F3B853D|nr:phosphoglycerate mutase family protein [Cronobacter dublinensis]